MATQQQHQTLTDDELAALRERAEGRPRLAQRVALYERHATRIANLRRVLDPADERAQLNLTTGSDETVRAEIARRAADLDRLVPDLRQTLKDAGAANG